MLGVGGVAREKDEVVRVRLEFEVPGAVVVLKLDSLHIRDGGAKDSVEVDVEEEGRQRTPLSDSN